LNSRAFEICRRDIFAGNLNNRIHPYETDESNLALLLISTAATANFAQGQDWPQWRGANRDGKSAGFNAPKTWPKELTKKWQVTVGDGDATPSLADINPLIHIAAIGNGIEMNQQGRKRG
jgi:hypothetical protein